MLDPISAAEALMRLHTPRIVLSVALLVGAGACAGHKPAPGRTHAEASTVTAEQIEKSPEPTVAALLQGRVSGVTVEEAAGGGLAVRIRGSTSFYAGSEPLYIVDGVPFTAGPGGVLTGLNPHDIESIRVLKNPEDTAIYGVRGANGVILVKTKRSR